MARRPSVTQADLTRCLKAAIAAGAFHNDVVAVVAGNLGYSSPRRFGRSEGRVRTGAVPGSDEAREAR